MSSFDSARQFRSVSKKMNNEEKLPTPQDQQATEADEIIPSDLEQVSGGLNFARKAGEKPLE